VADQCPLLALHPAGLIRLLMIVAKQVQNPVNHQPGHLASQAVTDLPGLTAGGRHRYDDVPQKQRRGTARPALPSNRSRKRQGKSQHIGRSVFAAINFVQGSDPAVV